MRSFLPAVHSLAALLFSPLNMLARYGAKLSRAVFAGTLGGGVAVGAALGARPADAEAPVRVSPSDQQPRRLSSSGAPNEANTTAALTRHDRT